MYQGFTEAAIDDGGMGINLIPRSKCIHLFLRTVDIRAMKPTMHPSFRAKKALRDQHNVSGSQPEWTWKLVQFIYARSIKCMDGVADYR